MDEDAIAAVVKEIEEEKALGRVSAVQVFKSILNQPALVSISSASATAAASVDGYSGFTVNMPRPILSVGELELMTANIPLCTQNIPDTACAFWYYRLSLYSGKYPNPNNLYFVRLLPSYYRQEFIQEATAFGFNQTFDGYTNVATQLALACAGDLAQENYIHFDWDVTVPPYYRIQYMKDEIKFTYNSSINKFQFAGNQGLPLSSRDPQPIVITWAVGTTYAAGDRVKSPTYVQGEGYIVYEARVASTGQALPTYPKEYNTYWTRSFSYEGVADWNADTPYYIGRFVAYNDVLYQCIADVIGQLPSNASYWTPIYGAVGDFPPMYQFMVTGYNDPNVAIMQGTSVRQWSPYALFEAGDRVQYNGRSWTARVQCLNQEPTMLVPNVTTNAYAGGTSYVVGTFVSQNGYWYECIVATTGNAPPATPTNNTWWRFNSNTNLYTATRSYQVGDYVNVGSQLYWYKCILATRGNAPSGSYSSNTWWQNIEYDANKRYVVGDLVSYYTGAIKFWECVQNTPPGTQPNLNPLTSLAYWKPAYWDTDPVQVPIVGLAAISAGLDMMDDYAGVTHYPYPEGIPPQPFNPVPKRLLNSILGFTWNGQFTPSMLSVLYDPVTIAGATTVSQLLNRIRPLPVYYQNRPALGAGYDPTSIQDTFVCTANGYANLVYSSVINIYATITSGSSLDTVRNTNLLGTMPMSAGNLGIGFSANFINCELETQESDIYSITFSFTDEFGEPYPLTNNAVVTMTLKMGYRSKAEVKNGGDV